MREPVRADVDLRCDCGHSRTIPYLELDHLPPCPACGDAEPLCGEQRVKIDAAFAKAMGEAIERREAGDTQPTGIVNLRN